MIRFKSGDILAEDVEALVNTVNCVGIMGRGIALQFKKAFPGNFRVYSRACERGDVQPGRMFLHETGSLTNPRYIINFPTKRHWRGRSRIEDIEAGLENLVELVHALGLRSIALPPLGSGLGGLDWSQVRQRILEAMRNLDDVDIVIFEPNGAPETRVMARHRKVPTMTTGRAALVGLMHRYLNGLLDPFVTLLEIHKLMYFMQIAGQPLKLRFVQGPYGPYAENLRHVLNEVEGYHLSGYADGGDSPGKPLELVPGAIEEAVTVLHRSRATHTRFNRVAELVEGFESPIGLELLSTVHWVLEHEKPKSPSELVANIYGWNQRKTQFSPRQIALAAVVLKEKEWISGDPVAATR